MIKHSLFLLGSILSLTGCAYSPDHGTISELDSVKLELKDTRIDDGLDKAMSSYQHFLNETPESGLTPEAIRRLADLKVEKDFGTLGAGSETKANKTDVQETSQDTDNAESKPETVVTKGDAIANV